MNPAGARRWVLLAWLVAVAIVTWGQLKAPTTNFAVKMPDPSAYVGSAMVYSVLALLAEAAPQVAALFAVGATIGLAYKTNQRAGQASHTANAVPPVNSAAGSRPL